MTSILDKHKNSFESDPSNRQAFEALEEHLFMQGAWDELVALYNRRLEAPEFADEPARSIPILFRLAQVCEERARDIDLALEHYWRVAKLDPTCRPALRQLRQIYSGRGQWDMLLQIAEMEGQLEMEPHERATFLAELGDIWIGRLNDPTEALARYQQSLALVPDQPAALAGLAQVHEGLGHHKQAAAAWERLSNRLRGPDRAPVLVSLGNLLATQLDQADRAADCFERALADDPRCAAAAEALSAAATHAEDWPRVAKLCERRFDIASGARKRAQIAVAAGRLHLAKLDDIQAARLWFERALELVNDDASVYEATAELARHTGNRTALRDALDRAIELAGAESSASLLLEAADLYSESGDEQRAVGLLRRAQIRAPDNALVAETLSDSLSRLGLSEELVDVLERRAALIEDDPQAESEIHAEIGRIRLEDQGEPEAASASFARAFDLDPGTPGVAARLESLYRKREAWDELRPLLERAAVHGPVAQRAHCFATLGELREQHFDEPEAATAAFESALELDPQCLLAHRGVARIVDASGSPDDLLRICEREAEVTGDRARLAELVWTIVPLLEERERDEDALGWVERLAESSPEDRKALEAIARLRESLGRRDQLLGPLERLDPLLSGGDQTRNRRRLAGLHREAGHRERAIEWYQSSLDADPADDADFADDAGAAGEPSPDHVECLRSLKALYRETRDFEGLARNMRRLAEALPETEANRELSELADLLVDQLGDVGGAIAVLGSLVEFPREQRPDGVAERLEDLLERAGRFEELAQRLLVRRRDLGGDDNDSGADGSSGAARQLDLRRAKLYLENLGQYEEAAAVFRSLRAGQPGDVGEDKCEDADETEVLEGLESALRLGHDAEGLVALLADLAAREPDAAAKAELELERATLLEDPLAAFDEARLALRQLASQDAAPEVARQAGQRLELLFSRCADWDALRDWLTGRLGSGDREQDLSLHERLARLCRDQFGEPEACVEHLEAAGAIAPDRQATWHNLALLYRDLDRPKDLLRVLECELALDPDREREAELRARAARLAAALPEGQQRCGEHYERLLALDPGNAEASEFLLDFYEREQRPAEMVRLLRARLDACLARGEPGEIATASVVSLRLRIAALESEALEDDEAAATTLAPAIAEQGPSAAVAGPLADLYQRLGRRDELIALSLRAADACSLPEERASWLLRAGDARRRDGDACGAAEAYRCVLEACPQDLDAQSALRELYRELAQAAPLAELLSLEVARRCGASAIPPRLELATLLADPLARPTDALEIFLEILEVDARHPQAFVRALDLTRVLERHDQTRQLLASGLAIATAPTARAALLERLGDLEAGPLEQPTAALGRYREALTLDPSRPHIRESLCELLSDLERFPELLDCLFVEAQRARPGERGQIFERAIAIARDELDADAALPWLERLRAETPEDPGVPARIADIHQRAGRPEARLRALEAQRSLLATADERQPLCCVMAEILDRDLGSPSRAAAALEQARALDPEDSAVLAELDRLYERLGRPAERVAIIEERIANPATCESLRATLHREAAELWHPELASPEAATPHLLHCIDLCEPHSAEFVPLTQRLQQTLRASGELDGWARAAQSELDHLSAVPGPNRDRRRAQLHAELANCYEHQLARPQLALRHTLTLLDEWDAAEPLTAAQIDAAEVALIEHLRRERNHVELAQRLARRLERIDGGSDEWLELARLQWERLHQPSAARSSFRRVLAGRPNDESAIRGLRQTAEVLRDWEVVAESLERELALEPAPSREQTCRLLRRLGEIARRQLRTDDDSSMERAARAYSEVLRRLPDDLESLRALQEIGEERGQYAEAIGRYRQEVGLLGDREPQRRQRAWLRVAELARDETDEPELAIEAYVAAAQCGELPPQRLREWAALYRSAEDWEHYAEIHGRWCDAPESPATCRDLLLLVDALDDLGRRGDALERVEMAIDADRGHAVAWQRAGELHERDGNLCAAADRFAEAAERCDAAGAVLHLLRASQMLCEREPARAAELLRRGAERDPASAESWARLAVVSERLQSLREAETAAGHALDLVGDHAALEPGLLLNAALAGGRAAWQGVALESATRLFSAARELDPANAEALDSLGELLYLCGDVRRARDVLEPRLAICAGATAQAPGRARQHAIVAEAFELEADFSRALAAFERAIALEAALAQAHEGIVRIHERCERPAEAIRALDRWNRSETDPVRRSALLLRSAELAQSIEETDSAIARLGDATEANPGNAGAWTLLADLLMRLDRPDAALATASSGLAASDDADRASAAVLAFVRGWALERAGEAAEAAAAYGLAVESDDAHVQAVLARARLLRAAGEWQAAANALGEFLENHREPADAALARVWYERGRLLAGPLERVEDGIDCYQRAIELDPDFTRAIEPLADLLSYIPERWREAVERHGALLAADPARVASVRALLTICRSRGDEPALRGGLAILRALGAATPEEYANAPGRFDLAVAENPQLSNPHWERLREMIVQSAQEISQALSAKALSAKAMSGDGSVEPGARHPSQRSYWELLQAAEAELSFPGFGSLATSTLAQTIELVAAMALDTPRPESDRNVAEQLERTIGRWARRKLRKGLEGTEQSDIAGICWDDWRAALRGVAAALALDRYQGDLRHALLALSAAPDDAAADEIPEASSIADRVRSVEPARALLREVTRVWCWQIGDR